MNRAWRDGEGPSGNDVLRSGRISEKYHNIEHERTRDALRTMRPACENDLSIEFTRQTRGCFLNLLQTKTRVPLVLPALLRLGAPTSRKERQIALPLKRKNQQGENQSH